ncbi:MAG: Hsp70 family protein [Deltaproteobacteria bacterium]|nr:Hsp70 family protein [Deltaproteobacteria bacterium]
MFIATRATKPEGTQLSFEIILLDGSRLMRGEGVVQRVTVDEQPGRSGMLVRFTRIDARTRALLDQVLAAREGVAAPDTVAAQPTAAAPEPITTSFTPPPQPAPKRGPLALADDVVLGVDLGTTTPRAAVFLDGAARMVPIPSERGAAMPSIVAWDEGRGKLLVGGAAKLHRVEHPQSTLWGFKRLLGRRARSRKVKEIARRLPFKVEADPEGDAGIELGGRVFSIPELAAELLKVVKDAAQSMLGRELSRAVLCVPAWYSDHQRAALLDAGRLAGLEVLRVLNEPSAVALAFGHGRGLARKRVLVYDLGGGTFDASVVEITGDDLEVVSTGGDAFLGGVDFDERLAEALINTLPEAARLRVFDSAMIVERVRDASEVTKIALSDKEKAGLHVPFVTTDEADEPVDLKRDVARAYLEQLTADLVERTAQVTQVVLDAAKLTPQSLDEVLLVGGQSRAPAVRRRMEALLGRAARSDVDPQGAVALGAALLGQSLVMRERGKRGLTLSEVLSAPIGVAVKGGGVRRILERNTRLPAEKTLAVPVEAGKVVKVAVFQGAAARAEDNEYLGALHATCDRSGELGLRFAVSADGRLVLSATSPTGKSAEMTFTTADASDEVHAQLLAEAPLPGEADPQQKGLLTGLRRLFGR